MVSFDIVFFPLTSKATDVQNNQSYYDRNSEAYQTGLQQQVFVDITKDYFEAKLFADPDIQEANSTGYDIWVEVFQETALSIRVNGYGDRLPDLFKLI